MIKNQRRRLLWFALGNLAWFVLVATLWVYAARASESAAKVEREFLKIFQRNSQLQIEAHRLELANGELQYELSVQRGRFDLVQKECQEIRDSMALLLKK
jgi:hypothetical protein